MMRLGCLVSVRAGVILLATLALAAASPVWNGTWKLNESKSNIPGPSFSITVLPNGEYRLDNGTYGYSFRCDGSEYPTKANRTISCSKTGAFAMDSVTKDNDKKIDTAHWGLSVDGKTLTIKTTATEADGSIRRIEKVYSRIAGSTGFAGGWQDTKRLESRPQLSVELDDRQLHIKFSNGQYMDVPLDGAEAPCHGPGVPQGLTYAVQPNGSRQFFTSKKFAGKVMNEGTLTISADGRTLIEKYWNPTKPDQKATLVYEKQ